MNPLRLVIIVLVALVLIAVMFVVGNYRVGVLLVTMFVSNTTSLS